MAQFEQFNPQDDSNGIRSEIERLYKNDLSPKKFSTKPYEATDQLPENKGQFGEADDKSAEERIYEKITPDEVDENNLVLGKKCNDYLNGLGEAPQNLTIEEIRTSALAYRESLSEEEQQEEDRQAVNLIKRDIKEVGSVKYTEAANLKPGLVAQATPNPLETTKLNRRSLWNYITGRRKEKV